MSLKARILFAGGTLYWRLFRPVTLGVRLLLIKDGAIVLVKHSYQPEWYLPGGGVKRNETLAQAGRREAMEEVGARLDHLQFFGIYSNLTQPKSDHVAVFLCQSFEIVGRSDYEIESVEFFPLAGLPADISSGSHNRIMEYLAGDHVPSAEEW